MLITLVSAVPATQRQVRHHTVALVVAGLRASVPPQVQGLHDGLEELGYVLGKNLTIELLRAEDYTELSDKLRNITQKKIDAIITTSGPETALARNISETVPIIFMPAGDPVQAGFVNSLANPGTNVTGLSFSGDSETLGKQLQLFKDTVPSLRSLAVLYDSRKEGMPTAATFEAIKKTAPHLATRLIEEPISSVAEAEQALKRAHKSGIDGVFLVCSPVFRTFKPLALVAVRHRLPLFGCNASQVREDGALLSYAPDMHYIGFRGAQYLDRVLRGARPQDLPVETPKRFELVINLRTANEIGLKIPPEVLMLADKVVQ